MGRTRQRIPAAEAFGQRVRERRLRHKWSQEYLAELAGVHMTYLSSVERGERNVSLVNILRIAQALEVDAGRLVEGLKIEERGRQ